MDITATVRKANGKSYSCLADKVVSNCLLAGYGKSAREAVEDFYASYRELRQMDGGQVPDISVELRFDVGSLFNYYGYLNINGVAAKAGINASVMRQYASGVRTPNAGRLHLIEQKIKEISREMDGVELYA